MSHRLESRSSFSKDRVEFASCLFLTVLSGNKRECVCLGLARGTHQSRETIIYFCTLDNFIEQFSDLTSQDVDLGELSYRTIVA